MFALFVGAGMALLAAAQLGGGWAVETGPVAVAFVVYVAMGGLIIGRRDGHLTGWLLLLIGLAVVFADTFGRIPAVPSLVAGWVASWAWSAVFALFAAMSLTFPSGRLPSDPGWPSRLRRGAAWALPILVATAALTEDLGGPEAGTATASPVGFLPDQLGSAALVGIVVILLGGALSLVVERRRTVGAERAQLTWVVFGFVVLVVAVAITMAVVFGSIAIRGQDPGDGVWTVAFVVMLLFPLTFGVAVLRYRLFEIDRIVSRTVTYALVAGLLAVVFFGIVTALTAVLPTESDLAVAASTLAVAALFDPLRRSLRGRVDRRFNRARFDAERVAEGFSTGLRHTVDPDGVVSGLVGVVAETMEPATVAFWHPVGETPHIGASSRV